MLSGDFAIGLMTIITGLAIADMIISAHGLLMNRRKVRWDWLALLAPVLIFLLIVSSWGISYKTMGNQSVNPPLWLFVVGLSQIIPLYLAARASLPDDVGPDGVDLGAHYERVSRYFWASIGFTYAMFVAYGVYALGPEVLLGKYLSPTAQLTMMAALVARPRQRKLHAVLVPLILLGFCYSHLMAPMFAEGSAWLTVPRTLP